MKRYLFLIVTLFLTSASWADQQTEVKQWVTSDQDYYSAFADSEDNNVQATLGRIQLNSGKRYIDFRLLMENKKFCSDNGDDYKGSVSINVNDQLVKFNTVCSKDGTINIYPDSEDGLSYITDQFDKTNIGKFVTFVIHYENDKDYVFKITKKNFKKIHRSIEKSLKETI